LDTEGSASHAVHEHDRLAVTNLAHETLDPPARKRRPAR
jgi:hypothetical protein